MNIDIYDTYESLAFFPNLHLFSERANFTNCLGNLDKKLPQGKLSLRDTRFLPEQCQISRSEEKKCLVWLGKNRDFAITALDPCLQTL